MKPRRPGLPRWVLASIVLVVAAGCSKSRVPLGEVEGTVNLDGKPLDHLLVVFHPEDSTLPTSTGVTDENGNFKLWCNDKRAGAVVGAHRVVVVDVSRMDIVPDRDADPAPNGAADRPASRVPTVYGRPDKTPLRQSVTPGSQTVAIELQSKQNRT